MMFMGSIVNGLTIIGGSLLGLILHNISANAKDTITKSLGLGTFALGIQMALQTKSFIGSSSVCVSVACWANGYILKTA